MGYNDASRWNKFGLITLTFDLMWIIWKKKPEIVMSTGAAPGYIALRLGPALGARTSSLDSIENVERLSMSGQKIGPHADLRSRLADELDARSGGGLPFCRFRLTTDANVERFWSPA
jgi:hypothetical protein